MPNWWLRYAGLCMMQGDDDANLKKIEEAMIACRLGERQERWC